MLKCSKFELKPGDIHLCDCWAFMSGAFSRADIPKADGKAKQASECYLFALKPAGWHMEYSS